MERRHFIAASLATSVAALATNAGAQAPAAREREYYLLREILAAVRAADKDRQKTTFTATPSFPRCRAWEWGPSAHFALTLDRRRRRFMCLFPALPLSRLRRSTCALRKMRSF